MGRPITLKIVQRHIECECGFNTADCNPEKITHKELRLEKAKLRLEKESNTVWYLINQKFESCFNCD